MFSGPSSYAEYVDNTMLFIVGLSVFMLLGITFFMIYYVFRYSRKRNPKATQIHGNVLLEVVWIVIPTIIVIAMFWYGYIGFKQLRMDSEAEHIVNVTAYMWGWEFEYENGLKSDTLFIPINSMTKLEMESRDVLHSLYIPAFRMKEDVIMGFKTFIFLEPKEMGVFDIACAEYCGLNHSNMYTKLIILEQDIFAARFIHPTETDEKEEIEKAPEGEDVTNPETSIEDNNEKQAVL